MADVLLTHSYHLPYDPKQVRKMQPYAPLGTLYAASALRAGDISVAVFDTMLGAPEPGFADALKSLLRDLQARFINLRVRHNLEASVKNGLALFVKLTEQSEELACRLAV